MGLMALMATALPPTQMSVLPSIVDASSKTAAAPTEAGGQQLLANNPAAALNGCSAPAPAPGPGSGPDPTNATNGGSLVKPQANGSRQSLTTNTVLERSPSSGSQILVPSNLKSSLPKLVGEPSGACTGPGATPLLSVAVVSNNGKVIQPELPPKTLFKPTTNLMLTFEGESARPAHTCASFATPVTAAAAPLTTTTTTTTTTTAASVVSEAVALSDSFDPEEDIMYCV